MTKESLHNVQYILTLKVYCFVKIYIVFEHSNFKNLHTIEYLTVLLFVFSVSPSLQILFSTNLAFLYLKKSSNMSFYCFFYMSSCQISIQQVVCLQNLS